MNKKSQAKVVPIIIISLILIISFLTYFVLADTLNTLPKQNTIFEDFGVSGMEISEIKIESSNFGEIKIEPNEKVEVNLKEIDFNKINIFEEKSNFNGIKHIIDLRNLSDIGFEGTLSYSQTILIDYDKVRWNGIEYILTSTPVYFGSWIDNETGRLIVPNIFMDDEHNKRINYRDIAEKGGYAVAKKNNGVYSIDLIIEDIDATSLGDFFVDPVYINETDGFYVGGSGNVNGKGIATNGSDFWICDSSNDLVYHYNSTGDYQDEWARSGILEGMIYDSNDDTLYALDNQGNKAWHFNLAGGDLAGDFNTIEYPYGGAFDPNDNSYWIVDASDDIIYHYDSGKSLTDGNITGINDYGADNCLSLAFDTTDNSFWCADVDDNFIYHFDSSGNNLSDGFNIDVLGGSQSPQGLEFDSANDGFWVIDGGDSFVYHFVPAPDSDPPNVTINTPLAQNYSTATIVFNVTAVDDTGMDTCIYTLTSGVTNYTMTNIGDDWNATNSSMAQGSHTATFYCNDTYNNLNNTESVTFFIDSINPTVGSLTESPNDPATYSTGATYEFNATITDTNLQTILIEFDGTNYTPSNTGDVYNFSISDLAVGSYNYRWYANDSLGNVNNTETDSYTIDKAVPEGSLTNTDTWTEPYLEEVTIGLSESNIGDGDVDYNVSRDGVDKGTGETVTLGVGTYDYVLNTTGGANWTSNASMDTQTLTIEKIASATSLTFSVASPQTYGTAITPTCSVTTGEGSAVLKIDGDTITSGNPITLGADTYSFNCSLDVTQNYTGSSNSSDYTIDKATLSGSLTNTDTWTEPYLEEVTIGLSETNTGDGDVTYVVYRDDVSKGTGETVTLEVNTYDYILNSTGGENYSSSASLDAETLTVTAISPSGSLAGSSPINYLVAGDVEGTETNTGDGECSYKLYRESVEVSNPDTDVLGVGVWNYVYNTTGCTNYTANASMDTFALTVNKISPSGSLTSDLGWTMNESQEVVIGLSESQSGDGDVTYIVYRDDVSKGTGETWSPALGTYDYVLNTTGGANWTSNASMDTETLTVNDVINPEIEIVYPSNNSNHTSNTIEINYTRSDTNLDSCWYSNDTYSINKTLTNCANITGITWSEGPHNVTVWANDTSGNENSSSVIFNIDTTPPTITFVSQTPADLSNFILYTNHLNISYNITDAFIGVNSSTVKLYHKTNNTISDTWIYINGTSTSGFTSHPQSKQSNVSEIWNFSDVDEEMVYPATYNFDVETFENNVRSVYDLDSVNEYIKIRLFNVSNAKNYSIFNVMANTSGSKILRIYYCNSSYSTGDPIGNENCINFYNLDATSTFNHSHSPSASYQVIPLAINTTSGMLGDIYVTDTSYFLLRGQQAVNSWDVHYITNVSRTDTIQTTTNKGTSWSNFSGTVDAHLHQYDGSDTFHYFVEACDSLGNCDNSTVRTDLIDLLGLPPIASEVYNPAEGFYAGNITINYTASLSPNGYDISFYNISLVNIDETFNLSIQTNNSLNLSYVWDSTEADDGDYFIRVEACDNQNQCSFGYSENITIDNTEPTITINTPAVSDQNTLPFEFRVTLNEVGTCEMVLNSESTKTMITSNNLTFTYSQNVDDGTHSVTFYCNDTLENNESSQRTFSLAKVGTSSGGSGTTYIIPITLEKITLEYDEWLKNEKNSLFVYTYNNEENLIDVEIEFQIFADATKEIKRIDEGTYQADFLIKEDLESVNILITAEENGKEIKESITIDLRDKNTLDIVKQETTKAIKKLDELIQEPVFLWGMLGFALLLIISIFFYFISKKNT